MSYPPIGPTTYHHPPEPGPARSGFGTWRGLRLTSGWLRLLAALIDLVAASFASKLLGDSATVFWLFILLNNGVGQSYTGRSLGKGALGLHLFVPYDSSREPMRQEIGLARGVLRCLLHLLDAFLFPIAIGYLLMSENRQTFADRLTGTLCLPTAELRQVASING